MHVCVCVWVGIMLVYGGWRKGNGGGGGWLMEGEGVVDGGGWLMEGGGQSIIKLIGQHC